MGQGGQESNRNKRGTPHSTKLQDWSLTIRRFCVISKTLFEEGLSPLKKCSQYILQLQLTGLNNGVFHTSRITKTKTSPPDAVECHTQDTPFCGGYYSSASDTVYSKPHWWGLLLNSNGNFALFTLFLGFFFTYMFYKLISHHVYRIKSIKFKS